MADLLATAKVAFQAIIEEHRMPDSDVIKLLVSQVRATTGRAAHVRDGPCCVAHQNARST